MRKMDKIATGLGSVLEWYDFALYGFFAPLIAQLYFPSEHQLIGLLKVFSIFAVGFIARPFGALLFGVISDKYGRTACLKITPLLITIPTLLFALLPTYQQIGALAPCMLILLRILQGMCIGGEFANSIIYLCETTQSKHIYFVGSIGSCTGSFGIFLASTVAAASYIAFPTNILYSWGWRLPFAISVIFGIVTFIIRKNMCESPIYSLTNENKLLVNNPLLESFREQFKDYIIAFGLTFLPATAFYYAFVFLPNVLNILSGHNTGSILGDNSLCLFARLFIIPILGIIAGKIGGIKIMRLACILFFVFSYPLFYGILYYNNYAWLFMFAFALLTTLNAATTPGLLIELLKPQTRCTIFSFTFNVSFGLFGGIVPLISLLLVQQLDSKIASVYYLMLAALITLIATFFFKKSRVYD